MHVRPRLLIAPVVLAALSAVLTACTGHPDAPAAPTRSSDASPSGSASPTATVSASPAVSAQAATPTSAPTSPAAPAKTPTAASAPAPATRLSLTAAAPGGGLSLVRGGPAQEFTVTVRNGNAQAYRHLLIAFQMEPLTGEPGDLPGPASPYVLERRDPATGAWRGVELRMATDAKPAHLYEGGSPLARDAVRTERYRLRATATGPSGSSPLMVYALDTDAAEGAPLDAGRPGYSSLPHTTRRIL
ncbi:hypothetical protein [Streptomyces sp. XY332]|uniref:hypothetical protein n=1 Tax=Streptomyces sp. XY332 TaxID=1415561 RepID=UPI000AB04C1F|nr:hypothetical protein [Streptomyces sp. XY332]